LETPLLNFINHQALIATKAARINEAAQGKNVLEFGLRRAHGLDPKISAKLMQAVDDGKLPFHKVTSDNLNPPARDNMVKESDLYGEGIFASPDGLLSPSYIARAAVDQDIIIDLPGRLQLFMECPVQFIICCLLSTIYRLDLKMILKQECSMPSMEAARIR